MTMVLPFIAIFYSVTLFLDMQDPDRQSIIKVDYDLDLSLENPTSLNRSETKLYGILWRSNGPLSIQER